MIDITVVNPTAQPARRPERLLRHGHPRLPAWAAPCVLLADKGYDRDFIRNDLDAGGVASIIPARRNRKVQPVIDGHIYALRNIVARCFSQLKNRRRLATR